MYILVLECVDRVFVDTLAERFELWCCCAVLSDHSKRTLYDAGMYDPDEEVEEVQKLSIC